MKTGKMYKVLVVDDNADNLKTLVDLAGQTSLNIQVLQETSAKYALEIAGFEIPDLIITDWEMPEMDGIELIRHLQSDARTRNIPVIMCTGIMTSSRNLKTAMDAGAVDYIRKPVDPIEFQARMRSMLQLSDSFQTIQRQVELVEMQKQEIALEKLKSDRLLENILPVEIAKELKANGEAVPRSYAEVTVMFTDFKGFTRFAEDLSPELLVEELNTCFSAFDEIMLKHGVEKIKTIGDAYMAVGGLPVVNTTHVEDTIKAARDVLAFMEKRKQEHIAGNRKYLELRIGLHTGPVVAGIVGVNRFLYDIWGDTVNMASRIESSGEVGKVTMSETTYKLAGDRFNCAYFGEVELKGKGLHKIYQLVD